MVTARNTLFAPCHPTQARTNKFLGKPFWVKKSIIALLYFAGQSRNKICKLSRVSYLSMFTCKKNMKPDELCLVSKSHIEARRILSCNGSSPKQNYLCHEVRLYGREWRNPTTKQDDSYHRSFNSFSLWIDLCFQNTRWIKREWTRAEHEEAKLIERWK